MPRAILMEGQTFGFLTVLRRAGSERKTSGTHKKRYATWLCRCTCGQEVVVRGQNLRRGLRKACALGHRWHPKPNGGSHHPAEYSSWENMRRRCYDKNNQRYKIYGARGIRVCDRWKDSFYNFFTDMGRKPSREYTIERNDVNGYYEPSNCRWATRAEQARNQRRSVFVIYEGERMLLLDVVAKLGLNRGVVYGRLKAGWPLDEALTLPVREKKPLRKYRSKIGVPQNIIHARLRNGWSLRKATTMPVHAYRKSS